MHTAPVLTTRRGPSAGGRDDERGAGEVWKHIDSVLARPAAQQPAWPEPEFAETIRMLLTQAPPVAKADEVDELRRSLADVAAGSAFMLQGGDCAETFAGNTAEHVRGNMRVLLRAAEILRPAAGGHVVSVGRLAGQYAKPRSEPNDSSGLPVYRGDMINCTEPSPAGRIPDPARMLSAYANAVSTMTLARGVTDPAGDAFYASHEALLLDYEGGLLRADASQDGTRLLGLSGHLLWIGERTRQLDGAHIGLAELIANPVAVKLGPGTSPQQAAQYAERLNPLAEPGRLTLISRMGSDQVRNVLPGLITAVAATGRPVIWSCDPMHGNTRPTSDGRKTRDLDRIADEVRGFFEVHRGLGTWPGGLHLEFTGDNVTECVGGAQGIGDDDLGMRYETACDPRLNASQALQIAGLAADLLSG